LEVIGWHKTRRKLPIRTIEFLACYDTTFCERVETGSRRYAIACGAVI